MFQASESVSKISSHDFMKNQTKKFLRCALAVFFAAWGNFAFCGEIHEAAASGDLEKVKAMLKDNPSLVFSKDDKYGMTVLHAAAMNGSKQLVEFLLTNKADINVKANGGQTALQLIATKNNKAVARLLLNNGADVNAKDNDGVTPLHVAAYNDS